MVNPAQPATVSRFRHIYLLVCLLAMIVGRPFLQAGGVTAGLITVLQLTCILAAAFAAIRTRRTARAIGGLLVAAIVFGVLHGMREQEGPPGFLVYAFLSCSIAFYLWIAVILLQALSHPASRVTRDTICGAINVYLILGVVWAFAYAMLETAAPGSFNIPQPSDLGVGDTELAGALSEGESARFERFLGFSFITQTTLGYGNIAPQTPRADALTVAQAIVGQFFIAVVVARFVALHLMQAGTVDPGVDGDA